MQEHKFHYKINFIFIMMYSRDLVSVMKQCLYLWEYEYTKWLHISVFSPHANMEQSSRSGFCAVSVHEVYGPLFFMKWTVIDIIYCDHWLTPDNVE
jgi:hypothetical protein